MSTRRFGEVERHLEMAQPTKKKTRRTKVIVIDRFDWLLANDVNLHYVSLGAIMCRWELKICVFVFHLGTTKNLWTYVQTMSKTCVYFQFSEYGFFPGTGSQHCCGKDQV